VHDGVRARIEATCNPPQWVPGKYCNLQFHYMCAIAENAKGFKMKREWVSLRGVRVEWSADGQVRDNRVRHEWVPEVDVGRGLMPGEMR
jgi:hypothetical protein